VIIIHGSVISTRGYVMKKTLSVLAIATFTLVACKKSDDGLIAQPPPRANTAVSSDASSEKGATAASPTASAPTAPADTPQAPMLALAYTLGLVVPADQVRTLMESHQEACERAGTDQCQVLSANAASEGDDRATASLTLRATPAWMRMFRTRAEADARDLGGKIEEAATQGDDLSTQVVDTEAAQRTRAAERERLTELMRRRTRDLSQTVQIEQQITQVQGQMDQAASELAAMRNRIVMQTVTVSYESAAVAAPKGASAPLQAAARSFMRNVYSVLAGLLTLASLLLPFALVGAPIAWWLARRRKPKSPLAAGNQP
jgi:hypothetical protein